MTISLSLSLQTLERVYIYFSNGYKYSTQMASSSPPVFYSGSLRILRHRNTSSFNHTNPTSSSHPNSCSPSSNSFYSNPSSHRPRYNWNFAPFWGNHSRSFYLRVFTIFFSDACVLVPISCNKLGKNLWPRFSQS